MHALRFQISFSWQAVTRMNYLCHVFGGGNKFVSEAQAAGNTL